MTVTSSALACRLCHRGPAEMFTIRRHVGMLVLQRFVKFRGPLCREHAEAVTKDFLKKTLVQGWWGYISFFVNFFVIATNLAALSKARKLPAPAALPSAPPPPPPPPIQPEVSRELD